MNTTAIIEAEASTVSWQNARAEILPPFIIKTLGLVTLPVAISTAAWGGLTGLGLFLVGFEYSWDTMRDWSAQLVATKEINWLITGWVVTLLLIFKRCLRYNQNARDNYEDSVRAWRSSQAYRSCHAVAARKVGVYGDAGSATDHEISAALHPINHGLAPMWEN